MAVGEHEVLRATLGLQPNGNVGDVIIEASEASEEINGEGPSGTLNINRELMRACGGLDLDVLDLLQQVSHCQDLILLAAHRPRASTSNLLQVLPRLRGERKGQREKEKDCFKPTNLTVKDYKFHPSCLAFY